MVQIDYHFSDVLVQPSTSLGFVFCERLFLKLRTMGQIYDPTKPTNLGECLLGDFFPERIEIANPRPQNAKNPEGMDAWWMHLHEKIVDVDVLSWLVIFFWWGNRDFLEDSKKWIQCFLVEILSLFICQIGVLVDLFVEPWRLTSGYFYYHRGHPPLEWEKKRCLKIIVWFTMQMGLSWRASKLGLEIHCFPTNTCILKVVLILPEFLTSQNRTKRQFSCSFGGRIIPSYLAGSFLWSGGTML